MKIQKFIPMVPPRVTHNDLVIRYKKGADGKKKPYVGKSDALLAAEAKWMAHLSKHRPERPLHGAIKADVRICFPSDEKHPSGTAMIETPDLDNIEKTLWDVLKLTGYIHDDRLVFQKHVCKMYNDPSGLFLSLEELV